jgi:hypothetical protein
MKRRTRIINFNSKFCDNPKLPNEFKGDANIESKFTTIKEYMNDYFTFVVNAAIEYLSHGDNRNLVLKQPKELQFEVDNYFTKCDKYHEFINEKLVQDVKGRISRNAVKSLYQEYIHDNGIVEDKNTVRNLFSYLSDKGYSTVLYNGYKKYIGLREKTEQEIINDNTKPEEFEKIQQELINNNEQHIIKDNDSDLKLENIKLKQEVDFLKSELENMKKIIQMQLLNNQTNEIKTDSKERMNDNIKAIPKKNMFIDSRTDKSKKSKKEKYHDDAFKAIESMFNI